MANLINQKFNRLLVIEKTDQRKQGSIVWKCLCDCGNICYVSTRNLKSNNIKSCGCLNNDKRKERILKYNEIKNPYFEGQKINELILLEKTSMRQNNNIVWKCQCSCGEICYINTSNLKHQSNCGNYLKHIPKYYHKDITNQRFGKLIALKPTSERLHNNVVWECLCDCGNICYKPASWLIDGSIQSCGCLKSKGEQLITQILNTENIKYQKEYSFQNLKSDKNKPLRFDFALFDNNNNLIGLIEYQGMQHFENNRFFDTKETFQQRIKRDKQKEEYCLLHNIPLLIIYPKSDKDQNLTEKRLKEIILNFLKGEYNNEQISYQNL